ncbi:DUF177 domain-containing protein [Candidatus Uabimicrobium sp. HlEnr_7]|uniref:YceD family protein n=1 Tax=Candidatus Uabimicrobium helgolandensis TaxID=3095367 RepID=UPI0035569464
MQLTASDISISGYDFARKMSAKKLDLNCKEDISISGTASRSGSDIFVKAKLRCVLMEECHRCLAIFDLEIDSNIDLFFQPLKKGEQVNFQDLDADELGILYYRDNTINLEEAIRDTILIEKPIKVLCTENCKGLCVSCGFDLNESECSCSKDNKKDNPFMEFLNDSKKNSDRKT